MGWLFVFQRELGLQERILSVSDAELSLPCAHWEGGEALAGWDLLGAHSGVQWHPQQGPAHLKELLWHGEVLGKWPRFLSSAGL